MEAKRVQQKKRHIKYMVNLIHLLYVLLYEISNLIANKIKLLTTRMVLI